MLSSYANYMEKVRSTVPCHSGKANHQPLNSQLLTDDEKSPTTITDANSLWTKPTQHIWPSDLLPPSTWLYPYYIWLNVKKIHVGIFMECYWLLLVCVTWHVWLWFAGAVFACCWHRAILTLIKTKLVRVGRPFGRTNLWSQDKLNLDTLQYRFR